METSKKPASNILRSYLRYLKLERNYSPNTVEAYRHDMEWLTDFCRSEGKSMQELELSDLELFAVQLHEHGISPSSQARILSGVRSFYRFMLLDGYIDKDPTELLESPQLGRRLPSVLTTEEVDAIEQSIDLSKPEGQRNRAIIEVLFSCGLRVSELVDLRLSNLYLDEGFIRVNGKGSKERLVPISGEAIKQLGLWFEDRKRMNVKPGEEDYVFLNRRGHHLTRTMILIMLKTAGPGGRHYEDHFAPHLAPLLCHCFAQGRSRPACYPGHARARGHQHHRNLHARRQCDAPQGDSWSTIPETCAARPTRSES